MSTTPENPFVNQAKGKLGSKIQEIATDQATPKSGEIDLSLIVVKDQVREEFEDDENTLQGLADTLKTNGFSQPLLVRPIQGGKYELVAGERRYRAAKLAGIKKVPVYVRVLTDEEAAELQFIENIQRKNLTLQEEANKIQRELNQNGGDRKALCAKYGKQPSWLSKMTGLLKLPEETKRLMTEDISADVEVINNVKQIEAVSPAKAKEVVDTLKATRGKQTTTDGKPVGTAREISQAAKDEVKPPKTPRAAKKTANTDTVATPKNRDAEQPGPVTVFPKAGAGVASGPAATGVAAPALAPSAAPAWTAKLLKGEKLDEVSAKSMQAMQADAQKYFDLGKKTDSWLDGVLVGLEKFYFSNTFAGRLNLAAFSAGFDKQDSFEMKSLIEQTKISK